MSGGVREPCTSPTARRVESAPTAATVEDDGPDFLDRVVEDLDELAEFFCSWCGPRPWSGGAAWASAAIGHGRADADGVGR
jgi:hypothetical protein